MLLTLIIVFCVLVVSVLILGTMRKLIGRQEEELLLHVGDPDIVEKKSYLVHRVDLIEKWGKTLTVVTLAYGILVLVYYLWLGWQQGARVIQ